MDYTYNKENRNSIGHFSTHENRKNKPNKVLGGGDKTPLNNTFVLPSSSAVFTPKACAFEIRTYKQCVRDSGNPNKCIDEKLNIMEICPKWTLELLREKKRKSMRTTLIDNQTYRRAMEVSDYNKGRTVADIKEAKTWIDGTPSRLRTDA